MCLDTIMLVKTLPCLAEPGKIIVVGKPSRSLDEVLPYLATLPGVITYNPQAGTLTFRRHPGLMTLYQDRVYITQVRDRNEGLALLNALVDAINATWNHRHDLTPISTPRRAPRLFDVWSLLPRTNCKQCGETTCIAFAVALLQHRRTVSECKHLETSSAFDDRKAKLKMMIGDAHR